MADGSKTLESKKARAAAKRSDGASLDKILSDFDAQAALMTNQRLDQIEASFLGLAQRRARRAGLLTLTMSGMELTQVAAGDRDGALALAVSRLSIYEYARQLRDFADMMESAGARIGVALCSRHDMQELLKDAIAEAENPGELTARH